MIDIKNLKIQERKSNCSLCEKKALIFRKHSGQFLCADCFQTSIEKIIAKTISKYNMLKPRDKIIVGLSGGKDSITLLYNLIKIQKGVHEPNPIITLIIDEGIRGYRDNSIEIAKKFCKKYDIEYKILSFKESFGLTLDEIIKIKKQQPDYKYACNYCATIRRRLLNDGARELGGNVLAMGHNLTDIAETFLMNILYKRLNLIGSQFILKDESKELRTYYLKKITPLFKLPEEEILIYANTKKFDYYSPHCPYREADPIIRRRVLEFIQSCKQYSPEIEFNLLNGFLELSEIVYNHYGKEKYNSCNICGYPTGIAKICTYCTLKKELNV
ncbi:MAG: ATP-binding protein [Promethearchaeia archaeon]